jgi:hypothetical protein
MGDRMPGGVQGIAQAIGFEMHGALPVGGEQPSHRGLP